MKLNGGGDLCFPTLNNKLINVNEVPLCTKSIWNYDMMFKIKEHKERLRFDKRGLIILEIGEFLEEILKKKLMKMVKLDKRKYRKHVII